jgi:hypothetical protein
MLHPNCQQKAANSAGALKAPLPRLTPYKRCACGTCEDCRTDAKWDAVFAKFEVKQDSWPTKGFFQSTLKGY